MLTLQRGEKAKAKWQYEKILGKALMGRGPAEHWAFSEYAWICKQDGDLKARAKDNGSSHACELSRSLHSELMSSFRTRP